MDALELLVNVVALPAWPNRHPSASSWKTFCVPECARRTMAHCSRGTSLSLKAKGARCFSQLLEQGPLPQARMRRGLIKPGNAPFRAPMIIAVVAKCQADHKVPVWEQEMSAGCAVMAMQMAAVAQGFNGIWRTGPLTESSVVRDGFACGASTIKLSASYISAPRSLKPPAPISVPDTTPFVSRFISLVRNCLDSEHPPQNSDSHTYHLME